jgi:hypothetical protein
MTTAATTTIIDNNTAHTHTLRQMPRSMVETQKRVWLARLWRKLMCTLFDDSAKVLEEEVRDKSMRFVSTWWTMTKTSKKRDGGEIDDDDDDDDDDHLSGSSSSSSSDEAEIEGSQAVSPLKSLQKQQWALSNNNEKPPVPWGAPSIGGDGDGGGSVVRGLATLKLAATEVRASVRACGPVKLSVAARARAAPRARWTQNVC